MKKISAILGVASILAVGAYLFTLWTPPNEICTVGSQWSAGGTADLQLNRPMGIAWSNGFLYVADTENGAVKKIGEDGSLVAEWNGFKRPVAVAVTGDAVYVADFLADRVTKLGSGGTVLARWGESGTGDGEFDAPSGVAVDSEGGVYVVDFYNHRVQKFTADGRFLLQWGGEGRWNAEFRYPTEIAVNDRGDIFVADAYNHRIQKFTSEGDYIGKWGGVGYGISGTWPGWFRLAKAIAVDSMGDVYVADAFNRRIQKFTGAGAYLGEWGNSGQGSDGLEYPAGVAIDGQGRMYVSDFFKNRIRRLECR